MPEDQYGQASAPSRRKSSPKTAAKIAVSKPAESLRVADPQVDELAAKPLVERRAVTRRPTKASLLPVAPGKKPAAKKKPPVFILPELVAAAEKPMQDSQPAAPPERRVTEKSLFERRMADPSAKERRRAASAAKIQKAANDVPVAAAEPEKVSPVDQPAPLAAEPVPFVAEPARPTAEASSSARFEEEVPPVAERRVADRRLVDFEADLRAKEQNNRLGDMAVWMRKGGAALIGLNLMTVIAVVMLGRVHQSQLQEMKRATAASGAAAYAACLGTQTARNMLLELKAERLEPRRSQSVELPSPQVAPTQAQTQGAPAQLDFDAEKTTNVAVHIPVLFHFTIQNTGQSPALHAKVWSAVRVIDAGQEPDFKYDDVSLAKASISPNKPAAKVITYTEDGGKVAPLRDADYQRVSSGAAYVVAYGRAIYEDVYGAKHWAEFCRYVTQPAAGEKRSSKCLAYNGEGVSEPAAKPAEPQKPAQIVASRNIQTASVNLPEIACEVPRESKN